MKDQNNNTGMGTNQKVMEIWTIHDNKWYDRMYQAPSEKYEYYLPTVEAILTTLKIQYTNQSID